MPSLNKCQFIGNLGRDPELRYTPSGRPVCQFSIAVNRRWKDRDSEEWQEATEWVTAIVWGDSGERAAEQLRKGMLVYIEARQETQSWDDRETGKKAYRTVHVVSSWQNLTKREGGNGFHDTLGHAIENDQFAGAPAASERPVYSGGANGSSDLDDLPF